MITIKRLAIVEIILFTIILLVYYLIESRSFVNAFYGTCMLISIQGQDDSPETNTGKILIGIFSIINAMFISTFIWLVIEIKMSKYIVISEYQDINVL